MTKRTQDILKQINSLQEQELHDILYQMAKQHRLAKHIRVVDSPNQYVYTLYINKTTTSSASREDVGQALQKIQQFNTFANIHDPVLWQQQQRNDR